MDTNLYIIPEVRQMIKDLYITKNPVADMMVMFYRGICLSLYINKPSYKYEDFMQVINEGRKESIEVLSFWKWIGKIREEIRDESFSETFDKFGNRI